jgi:hypothetical protein
MINGLAVGSDGGHVPTPALLDRMSPEAIEHNKRTHMQYGLAYRE